jgi:predicted Rossmann fold flavoprotein
VRELTHDGSCFRARLEREGKEIVVEAQTLVLATGGKSIPKMGATGLAYDIARQFGLGVTETRPALVPLTFADRAFADISGVATPVRATAGGASFEEALLFSHRGLTGPAILQASSYWREGDPLQIDLMPGRDARHLLAEARQTAGKRQVSTLLAGHLPGRLVERLGPDLGLARRLGDLSDAAIEEIATGLQNWTLHPNGTEGYRTAEVTLGGIDTDGLSSKTLEARTLPGLYVIGEAVDVTGWLGGYNFQWAWSSAHAAGTAIAGRA